MAVFTAVVCFSRWYLKADGASITKRDIQVFHDESTPGNPFILGSKG